MPSHGRNDVSSAKYIGSSADVIRNFFKRVRVKPACASLEELPRSNNRDSAADVAAAAWKTITRRGPLSEKAQDLFFGDLPPPRATADGSHWSEAFTEEEVMTALLACPRGKAAGPDGLPNDWYRDNATHIVPILTLMFNNWFDQAIFPPSFRQASIVCVPKNTAPRMGLDFRPIALLNTDYKIFTWLLLKRISAQVPKLVAPTQFGFVDGRQVHDAIDVWTALRSLARVGKVDSSALAVLLAFAKAYDILDRRFLILALRRLGFPTKVITAVDQLHMATTATYLAEDSASEDQDILNGIRQGCPLAPVLFILAVDTLYDLLAREKSIQGIRLPSGQTVTAVGFADDTTVYLRHHKHTRALKEALDRFAAVSGLHINVSKCIAAPLGLEGWPTDMTDIGFPRIRKGEATRLLGAQLVIHPVASKVWEIALQQLRARLHFAQLKTTDLLQRVQIARAIIVPKILFVGRHEWPTASRIAQLQPLRLAR